MRKELGGGSHEDIGPSLARWKARRDYQPVVEEAGLPLALEGVLARFGAQVLEQARIETARERLAETDLAARGREANERIRDEALAHADLLEAKVAALQAEIERLRAGAPVINPEPVPAPAPLDPPSAEAAFIGIFMGQALARKVDAFWDEVREAVEAEMRRQGPLAVHALHGSLPAALKDRGARIGMPLTPAWLRYHLLRRAEAGEGVAEVKGRFVLVVPAPPASAPAQDAGTAPADEAAPHVLSGHRFWKLFVAEVYDLMLAEGPLSVDEILDKLPPGWVEATRRYGKAGEGKTIRSGKLREKLNVRICKGRPLKELDDGRFAATDRCPGSRTLSDEEAA
ncbi:replication region DNA-binding N-term [Methylobacterium sp. yr596]|nr:replication region DNA-binding N-term [Methylobacterium sp. yr596]